MGVDVIHAAFRAYPIGSVFLCPERARGGLFSGNHSGAQGRVFRKKRFADALRQAEENGQEGSRNDKGALHQHVAVFFRGMLDRAGQRR